MHSQFRDTRIRIRIRIHSIYAK